MNEERPLNYLNAPTQLLFTIARLTGSTYSGPERTRIRQELLAATSKGIDKSTDGGDTWTDITHNPGLPAGIDGKIGVTVSGSFEG